MTFQREALSGFLSRTEWDSFSEAEKCIYLKLNDWTREPVTKRMYDLIQNEKDINLKTQMTNNFVSSAHCSVPASEATKKVESRAVSDDRDGLAEHFDEKYSDPQEEFSSKQPASLGPSASLQHNSDPARSKTTLEEREAIKQWGLEHPDSSAEERNSLALRFNLTRATINRILAYERKVQERNGTEVGVPSRSRHISNYKEHVPKTDNELKRKLKRQNRSIEEQRIESKLQQRMKEQQMFVEKRIDQRMEEQKMQEQMMEERGKEEEQSSSQLDSMQTVVPPQNTLPPATLPELPNFPNFPTSQLGDERSTKVKEAIRKAIQSGNLKNNFNPNKPFKVIIKTSKPKQPPSVRRVESNTASKYNALALDSYFKDKPSPTENQIDYFVQCTQVPLKITMEYLNRRRRSENSFVNSKNEEFQAQSSSLAQRKNQVPQPTAAGEEIYNVDQETLSLVRKIRKNNFTPELEKELKTMFGNKIFCTFDNIKAYSMENGFDFQEIYKKLNSQPQAIQLVSDETCKRILAASAPPPAEAASPVPTEPTVVATSIKQEMTEESSLNNWLTSSELLFESSEEQQQVKTEHRSGEQQITEAAPDRLRQLYTGPGLTGAQQVPALPQQMRALSQPVQQLPLAPQPQTLIQHTDSGKRKSIEMYGGPQKRMKENYQDFVTEKFIYNDSGYLTNEDSRTEANDSKCNSDLLSNIIMENIGEVNMLNDSLDLFNDSMRGLDLVNEMYQKVNEGCIDTMGDHLKDKMEQPNEGTHEQRKLSSERSNVNQKTDEVSLQLNCNEVEVEATTDYANIDLNSLNDTKKIFFGPFESYQPRLQVVSLQLAFKSDVYEVRLSDGVEMCSNFYFKTGALGLQPNLWIKLIQTRHMGAKICVDKFEILSLENSIVGKPVEVETEFFSYLRRSLVGQFEKLNLKDSPKTIMDYVCLEETMKAFIENSNLKCGKEILFRLCKYETKLPSRLLKILSKLLNMEIRLVQQCITENSLKVPSPSQIFSEHGYCNSFKTFLQI